MELTDAQLARFKLLAHELLGEALECDCEGEFCELVMESLSDWRNEVSDFLEGDVHDGGEEIIEAITGGRSADHVKAAIGAGIDPLP